MHGEIIVTGAGTLAFMVVAPESLPVLNAKQLREIARDLIAQIASRDQQIAGFDEQIAGLDQQIVSMDQTISSKDREILYRQAKIDQLTHEMAVLKRWKFGRSREHLDAGQASLLDETIDADIVAIEQELRNLTPASKLEAECRPGSCVNRRKPSAKSPKVGGLTLINTSTQPLNLGVVCISSQVKLHRYRQVDFSG